MRVINIICDRIWIVRGLAAILEATLKSDCAWIPPCSFMPYHSSCNLIPIHFGLCCVLHWKAYQADLDQPIWIFVILSHLVDFKLIRIFAWHSLGHSEWPYLTFNYYTAFVEAKFIYFCVQCWGLFLTVCINEEGGGVRFRVFGCLHVLPVAVMSSPLWITVQVYFHGNSGGSHIKGNKPWQAIGDSPLSALLATCQTYTFSIPLIDWFYGTWLTLSSILPSGPRHQLGWERIVLVIYYMQLINIRTKRFFIAIHMI